MSLKRTATILSQDISKDLLISTSIACGIPGAVTKPNISPFEIAVEVPSQSLLHGETNIWCDVIVAFSENFSSYVEIKVESVSVPFMATFTPALSSVITMFFGFLTVRIVSFLAISCAEAAVLIKSAVNI